MTSETSQIQQLRATIMHTREQIALACNAFGSPRAAATIVAASKTQGAAAIEVAIAEGIGHFGENRVQEAQGKWPEILAQHPNIRLHLIGALQSNKAEDAVALFDVIETIDREKIADAVARASIKLGKRVECLVQINTGAEPQKAGALPEDADALIAYARDKARLNITGLMCVPPTNTDPAPHFLMLADIAARNGLVTLSMGMSSDYQIAIACGATHIRLGTALFGARG